MPQSLDPDTHYQLVAPINQALKTARSDPTDIQEMLSCVQQAHSEAERILPTSVWVSRDEYYDQLQGRLRGAPPKERVTHLEDAVDVILDETYHLVGDE